MAKLSIMRKSYVMADGSVRKSAHPEWQSIRFELFGTERKDDKPVVVKTVDYSRDTFSEAILACAAGHGLMQKLGDDMAGLAASAVEDGFTPDDKNGYSEYVAERLQNMVDNFANGVWVEEGEGSSGAGNVTILLEAICRAFAAKGNPLDDEGKRAMLAKLADKGTRDGAKKLPEVNMHIAIITAERAAERAKKAQEVVAANSTDGGALDTLLA